MKKNRLILILTICLMLSGCKGSPKNVRVDFVTRNDVFAANQKPNPLRLIVEIKENGNLSLNQTETGTIEDLTLLSERLKVIFGNREKSGFVEKEIFIDPNGQIKNEDLEKLIESLVRMKAAPVRVIQNNLE